jgi:hypothetical protein
MNLRLALALCALATPLHAQSLPTPNLGTGTKLNGAPLTTTATKGQGTSVADPGSGNLESLLPVQTVTGASKTFGAADLYKETRRSNSGSAMTDTFPGTSMSGLANGTTIQLNNVDTTASITISAGTGTTLNGSASIVIPALRSTKWVYDAPNTVWRSTMNSLSGVIGPSSSTNGNLATFSGTSGVLIQDSGKAVPSGAIVGTSDTQTFTNKTIDTAGPNTIKIGGVTVSAGQHPGTATNDNASAGNVGEYLSASVASGSAISLSNAVVANLGSIALTAGDWDVTCEAQFSPAPSTNISALLASISGTSAALDQTPGNFTELNIAATPGGGSLTLRVGPARKSISATTTYYCVVDAVFGTSTLTSWGIVRARRMR